MKTTLLVLAALLGVLAFAVPAASAAAPCPNEPVRESQPHGLLLPDCRAYEQVSPVEKGGQSAEGEPGSVEASSSGGMFLYFSTGPFFGPSGGECRPTYISSREGALGGMSAANGAVNGAWSTVNIRPEAQTAGCLAWDEDLSQVVEFSEGVTPEGVPLPPGEDYVYMRETATGIDRHLFTGNSVYYHLWPAGFSAGGSRFFFESTLPLLAGAAAGKVNLYEYDRESGALTLAGMVPASGAPACGGSSPVVCEPPSSGSVAGAGASDRTYTTSTVGDDGDVVFFTANGEAEEQGGQNGRIYARIDGEETIAASKGVAHYDTAASDGEYVFYTEGEGLYRFDTQTRQSEPITSGGGVLGTVGVSADGSTLYFADTKILTGGEKGPDGEEAEEGREGVGNLYVWHQEGAGSASTLFIANLVDSAQPQGGWEDDQGDWAGGVWNSNLSDPLPRARVTPDGDVLLFAKGETQDKEGAAGFFRYRAAEGGKPASLLCVTCYPAGSTPTVEPAAELAGLTPGNGFESHLVVPRNLSENGERVIFQSSDPLISGNNNGGVYEWEANGEGGPGGCHSETQDGGCLSLIGPDAYFGDASANGDDVFFFTTQRLASSDDDELFDVYDARVDAGACSIEGQPEGYPACVIPPKERTPCASAEECKPPSSEPPAEAFPATAAFNGPGNLVSPPTTEKPVVKPKTADEIRAEKLAKALKACGKKPRKQRAKCEKQARGKYAPVKRKRKK
jgi:hypothetical protein